MKPGALVVLEPPRSRWSPHPVGPAATRSEPWPRTVAAFRAPEPQAYGLFAGFLFLTEKDDSPPITHRTPSCAEGLPIAHPPPAARARTPAALTLSHALSKSPSRSQCESPDVEAPLDPLQPPRPPAPSLNLTSLSWKFTETPVLRYIIELIVYYISHITGIHVTRRLELYCRKAINLLKFFKKYFHRAHGRARARGAPLSTRCPGEPDAGPWSSALRAEAGGSPATSRPSPGC